MLYEIEIFFDDLKPEAQKAILDKFKTTRQDENWDVFPIAVITREIKEMTEPVPDKPDTKIYETEALYRYEKDDPNGNPLDLKFEVHKAGENGLYNEIAVDCLDSKGENVGSVYIGLDKDKKDMRVLLTADAEGAGDHVLAVYPMRPLSESVDSNYN